MLCATDGAVFSLSAERHRERVFADPARLVVPLAEVFLVRASRRLHRRAEERSRLEVDHRAKRCDTPLAYLTRIRLEPQDKLARIVLTAISPRNSKMIAPTGQLQFGADR